MTISQSTRGKTIDRAQLVALTQWLSACEVLENDSAAKSNELLLRQFEYGENVFESLKGPAILIKQAGHLSVGLPETGFSIAGTERFMFWFPTEIPAGRSICVGSSRLGHKLDKYDSWFDALRTLAVRLDPQSHFLITAADTTTDACIRRVGELFGIPVVELRPMPKLPTAKWFHDSITERQQNVGQVLPCFFQQLNSKTDATAEKRVAVDETLISIAGEAILLSVRGNGNIHAAAKHRLQAQPDQATRLLIDNRLTRDIVKNDLLAGGAVGWWLYSDVSTTKDNTINRQTGQHAPNLGSNAQFAPILDVKEIQSGRFLLHWTRRRAGPWPEQTQKHYLDDLIFQTSRREHGEVAAIARILASRRIVATNQLTRDAQPVVCFSNLPLTEIVNRKIFRRHLARWDFQPFGIAVDRDSLIQKGARPVIYGDQNTWQSLANADRPFFQNSTSQGGKIDWRQENEWRLLGDLNLNRLSIDSVVVFVASLAVAESLAGLSRWPIVVLEK